MEERWANDKHGKRSEAVKERAQTRDEMARGRRAAENRTTAPLLARVCQDYRACLECEIAVGGEGRKRETMKRMAVGSGETADETKWEIEGESHGSKFCEKSE